MILIAVATEKTGCDAVDVLLNRHDMVRRVFVRDLK